MLMEEYTEQYTMGEIRALGYSTANNKREAENMQYEIDVNDPLSPLLSHLRKYLCPNVRWGLKVDAGDELSRRPRVL